MTRKKQKLTVVQRILQHAKTRRGNLQKKLELAKSTYESAVGILHGQIQEQEEIIKALEKKV